MPARGVRGVGFGSVRAPLRAGVPPTGSVLDVTVTDRTPGVPGDRQDHEGDEQADDRVADGSAERNDGGAGDDPQRDEAVYARMVTVRDQRRTAEPSPAPQTYLGRNLVSQEANETSGSENPEVRELLGMD